MTDKQSIKTLWILKIKLFGNEAFAKENYYLLTMKQQTNIMTFGKHSKQKCCLPQPLPLSFAESRTCSPYDWICVILAKQTEKRPRKNCHLTRRGKGRVSVPYNTWYAWENFFLSLLWVLSLFLPNWQVRVFLRRILNQWTNKSWVHLTQHTPFGDRWFTAMARAIWWGLVNDLLMIVNWAAQRTPTNRSTNPKSPN